MQKTTSFRIAALGLAALVLSAALVSCKKKKTETPAPNTVVNVVANNGYTTLGGLVTGNANVLGILNGTGPFTVFAPSNAAFTGVTPPSGAALENLLKYHVIAGQGLTAAQVITLSNGALIKVTMANGDSAFVKASNAAGVFINGIQVTTPNLTGTNGIVHGIGRILFPPAGNIVQTAQGTPGFDSLVKAVTLASAGATAGSLDDIFSVLSNTNGLTVFAPTNQAFADLFANAGFPYKQISAIPVSALRTVLRHHVVAARAFSNDLANGNLEMFNGSNATVAGVGGATITIDGSGTIIGFNEVPAAITGTNIMARNGVVHVINKVLIP
ncbi:MAG: fasciclin domain-containing protein [Chitinophagaceae bacterium]|nr:fasciclin domain-containing protein [Chitinophagaceae bacterium]